MDKDLTKLIERLELFEERLGISLEGLYAVWNGFGVHAKGELHVRVGLALTQDIALVFTAYDDSGRVLETGEMAFRKERFYAFEAFNYPLLTAKVPSKIRIYPKAI